MNYEKHGREAMKKIVKKNQLMISALAIMLAIAGYLQFAESTITPDEMDLAMEIDSLDTDLEVVMDDYISDDMNLAVTDETAGGTDAAAGATVAAVLPEEGEVPGEAVFTSSDSLGVLSEAKLVKEQVRSKNKEMLLEIINNETLSENQKTDAVNTMLEMTQIAEAEAAAEILLEAKGFTGAVVSINGSEADVVVGNASLTDAQRAQIEDIVKRKTDISVENIVISTTF